MKLAFLSYRKSDLASEARGLYHDLERALGPGSIFFDERGITKGREWKVEIGRAIADSEVVVCLIGRGWLAGGFSRPGDMVRFEVSTALRIAKPVIPVILSGGQFPRREDLPVDMRGLVDHQGFVVDIKEGTGRSKGLTDLVSAISSLAPTSSRVIVKRAIQPLAIIADLKVFLDGILVTTLRPGEVRFVDVRVGEHDIQGMMTTIWLRQARTQRISFNAMHGGENAFVFRANYFNLDPFHKRENTYLKVEQL